MRRFLPAAAAVCLVLAWGAAPAKADYTPISGTVYIGLPYDYYQYTGYIDNATGQVTVTGTMVYRGEEYAVSADGLVRASGLKTPKKRYVATGSAYEPGLGAIPVSDAYGSTRDEAVLAFVHNVVAGVIVELMYPTPVQ